MAQERIRVNVTRAQVDAIVTDKTGKLVSGLTSDDFEVFSAGVRRPVESAIYISSNTRSNTASTSTFTGARIDARQISRSVAILIDDVKMSPASVYRTRLALHEFVDKRLTPGDLISIVCTSGGITTLQQFTQDRRILHRAVNRVRYQLSSSAAVNTDKDSGDLAFLIQRRFAVGAMAAIKFIAAGMRGLPGRKSIILLSDGFALSKSQSSKDPNVTIGEIRDVTDSANRSSVVIYAVDTRGLLTPPLQAEDDVTTQEVEQAMLYLSNKRATFTDNQQGVELSRSRDRRHDTLQFQ